MLTSLWTWGRGRKYIKHCAYIPHLLKSKNLCRRGKQWTASPPQEMRALSRKETDGLLFLQQFWWRKKQLPLASTLFSAHPPPFHNHKTVEALTLKEITYFSSFGLRVQSYEVTCRWCKIHGKAPMRTEVFMSKLLFFTEIYNLQTFLYTSEVNTSSIVIYQWGSHR